MSSCYFKMLKKLWNNADFNNSLAQRVVLKGLLNPMKNGHKIMSVNGLCFHSKGQKTIRKTTAT